MGSYLHLCQQMDNLLRLQLDTNGAAALLDVALDGLLGEIGIDKLGAIREDGVLLIDDLHRLDGEGLITVSRHYH